MKLNNTPVRTAKNFNINNIEIEDLELPEKLEEFEAIDIIADMQDISNITDKVSDKPLTYGTGKKLEENILEHANHKIRINSNGKNDNIKIEYDFNDDNLNLVNNIEIVAENEVDVIIKYKSDTDKICLHNGIIRVLAKENANVNVVIVNLLNDVSMNFEAIENELQENSKVNYTIIDIGGRYSVSNYFSNVIGKGANCDLKTVYLGAENQVKDINYIGHLIGEKSKIDIDVQGALKDNSKKNFKGTIDFKKGCKKAKGNENEYCMLLSDNARSIALPMLLCTEEDVEGNHSTASGKVEDDALFYIMSRGISYKEAIKLLVRARFNKIIERINDTNEKEEIFNEIDRRLG